MLQPGQISDVVKTQFGFDIIKVTDKKPGTVRTLAELRPQLTDQLSYERAQAQAGDLAANLEKLVTKASDLDKVAKAQGLAVLESGFFARDEPILGLGPAPEVAARAFEMKTGDVAGPLRAPRGYVFEAFVARQDPYLPKLDEAKERVRDQVVKEKTRDLSRRKAEE